MATSRYDYRRFLRIAKGGPGSGPRVGQPHPHAGRGGHFVKLSKSPIEKMGEILKPLEGGGMNYGLRTATLKDGTKVVLKVEETEYAHREILASQFGKILGAPMAEVRGTDLKPEDLMSTAGLQLGDFLRGKMSVVMMPHIAGSTLFDLHQHADYNPEQARLHFFANVVGDHDHWNPTNVMRTPEGKIVGIDWGIAFGGSEQVDFTRVNASKTQIENWTTKLEALAPTVPDDLKRDYDWTMQNWKTSAVTYMTNKGMI